MEFENSYKAMQPEGRILQSHRHGKFKSSTAPIEIIWALGNKIPAYLISSAK
jgi:hypothetical protein